VKKILFLVAHRPGRSPGQRFRFEQYLPYLTENGFSYEFSYLINENDDKCFYKKGHYYKKFFILLKSIFIRYKDAKRAKDFDIVFIYRDAVMFGSVLFEKKIKKTGVKMIFDFDDAIWLMDISDGNKNLHWLKRPEKTADIAALCNLIIVGNQYLADYALIFNKNVAIIPTTLETNSFKRNTLYSEREKICIGWTGSLTTLKHLELAVPFLKKIKDKYGDLVRFKVIADVPFRNNDLDFEFCKWNNENEIHDLCDIDIGIMPLPDDEWAKGKCGFKGLQYMAMEIPAVMSPVGVNTDIIEDGVNGLIASDDNAWMEKLSLLIDSFELREKLGKAGRKTIVDRFSFDSQKNKYLELFNTLTLAK
jgi:glycosyltransferase involved in cell wall biosynthesis